MPTQDRKLGKLPKLTDPRTLQLKNYLPAAIPAPPAHVNWVSQTPQWPMYDNDTLGDCVIAAMGHMIGQWTFLATGAETLLTDAQVIAAYSAIGGYVPGDPSTDNGCVMLDALNYWRNTGIAGHKIYAYAEVDPTNLQEIETAIQLFGNLFTGVALPESAQGKPFWALNATGDDDAGSWGDHCIPICSYDQRAMCCITWGEKLDMARGFPPAYADEAYAVLSLEWIKASGLSASGFNFSALQADLNALNPPAFPQRIKAPCH